MRGRTITLTVSDKRGKAAKTIPLYQYDYGQKLLIDGVELPEYYEVHFSNEMYGESVTVIGDSTGALIPDSLLATGEAIYLWLYLHDTTNDGETEYQGVIPVIRRAEPSDITPTPEEQSEITEIIALLNNVAGECEDLKDDAEEAAQAAQTAQAAAETAQTAAEGSVTDVTAAKEAALAAQAAAETAQAGAEAAQTAAETAQTGAATSATAAAGSATSAASSASAASTSQSQASSSASAAATSKTAAENAQTAAETAQTAAETAQTAAETAQSAAESAQSNAETAQTAAEAAQTAAETAQGKAEDAQEAAETAQGKAEDAQTAAETAASNAEAYAVGTRNGTDVESDDPAYENNAKYYAGVAEAVVSGKADLVDGATYGDIATLDADGNLMDSGKSPSDFALSTDIPDVSGFYTKPGTGIPASDLEEGIIPDVSDKLDAPSVAGTAGQVLTSDGEGGQAWADPFSEIDDTAGEGDTDATWSADKLTDEFSDVLNAIDGITDINKAIVTLFQHTAFTDAGAAAAYNTLYELVYDEPTPTPSPYQKVEYVETDGASRIDTGVQFDGTKNIVVTMEMSFNGTLTYNESILNGWAAGGAVGVFGYGGELVGRWSDGGEVYNADLAHTDVMTTVEMTINAGTNTNTVSSFENTYGQMEKTRAHTNVANRTFLAFPLFAMSKQDSFDYLKSGFRIKSVEIKVGDVIVRSMYACYRKLDNVIGFYDTVNDVFYTNAGTGSFTKGGDIE